MEEPKVELPALPETHIMLLSDLQSGTEPGYNRWHMQAYARAAVLQERERCARTAEAWRVKSPNNWNEIGQTQTADGIAAAIRKGE